MAGELPLGAELEWAPVERPSRTPLRGAHVLLRPVDPADAEPLFAVSHLPDGDPAIWTYLPDGPYESPEHLRQMLAWAARSEDSLYFTLVRRGGRCGLRYDERPLGIASYQRIRPEFGVIEIGHIWFGVPLQRTTAATEAIYLLARHAFDDLGYRRLEWKCNALNAASRRAAERFGFSFEGVFRNHQVVKGRNRDTAWYAITDTRWPPVRDAFEAWLAPENFDSDGLQKKSLAARGYPGPVEELGRETAFPALEEGTPVYDRTGERVGVVETVLIEADIFEGVIIHTHPLPGRHLFADVDQIAELRERGVLLSVDRDQLREPSHDHKRRARKRSGNAGKAAGETPLQARLRRAWDWITRRG